MLFPYTLSPGMELSRLSVGDSGVLRRMAARSSSDSAWGSDPMTASERKFDFALVAMSRLSNVLG